MAKAEAKANLREASPAGLLAVPCEDVASPTRGVQLTRIALRTRRGSTNPPALTRNLPAHPMLQLFPECKKTNKIDRAAQRGCARVLPYGVKRRFLEKREVQKAPRRQRLCWAPDSRQGPCQSTPFTAICWAFKKKNKKKKAATLLRWLKTKFFCKKGKSRLALHVSSGGRAAGRQRCRAGNGREKPPSTSDPASAP